MNKFDKLLNNVALVSPIVITGCVKEICGPIIKAQMSGASVGDIVKIALDGQIALDVRDDAESTGFLLGQVVSFEERYLSIIPFGETNRISPGADVVLLSKGLSLYLHAGLLGQVVDWRARCLSENQNVECVGKNRKLTQGQWCSPFSGPPACLSRRPVTDRFQTGIRAIDGLLSVGKGQRIGVFAEPGAGKSHLLSMIARHSSADVNVIALIGERGREVKEFVENGLDRESRKKTVVVASTSDQPAACRLTAAYTATCIAEYFARHDLNVLLEIDSATRLFRAYREVGLGAGEIPVRRGYPPSAFANLPKLIERTGSLARGTVTAFYTVLLSAGVDEDPMVEEIKSLTDGHFVLSSELANAGHYPAIDVVQSLSRLHEAIISKTQQKAARRIRSLLARIRAEKDLIQLGATADSELTKALEMEQQISSFLTQSNSKCCSLEETTASLIDLADQSYAASLSAVSSSG